MGKPCYEAAKDGGEDGLMAKTYTVKTKAPTGLSITRSSNAFTCKWKIGDANYGDGQTVRFRTNTGTFGNIAVGRTATSAVGRVDLTKFYPNTNTKLTQVQFAVRGKRSRYTQNRKTYNTTLSDWAYCAFAIQIPPVPSLTATLSDNASNVTTFAYAYSYDQTSHIIARDAEYQSILVKESNVTDGSKLAWNNRQTGWLTGTTGATYSRTITENTSLLANASYTRWFRVRSRGSAGASAWRYAKHVYAMPNAANISSAVAKRTASDGYMCTVKWQASNTASHPIDKVVVQYAFATPDAGMQCPDGASWTDAGTVADTGAADGLTFSVDNTVGLDQCLFVRVNTFHDSNVRYGTAKVADVGYLSDPTNLSVTTDSSTYRATVTCTNASAVSDSFLEIRYVSESNPDGYCCGVIPHGGTSATVACPDWSGETSYGFKVRAVVGSYAQVVTSDGTTQYAVTAKMASRNWLTYGGSVPQAPASVSLAMTDTVGTVQVTFDWSWQDAHSAEISWADHVDAWESTDEPETYLISNIRAPRWNISGLETGVTWYVRVRLVSGTTDEPTYGAYSGIQSIDLSSAPVVPVLALSDAVITQDGEVTASWVYVSTDSTPQAGAEVAEIVNGAYVTVAYLETAQYITLKAEDLGWETGENHSFAVRVTSASGRETGWSDPVSVYVAEPIVCEITQTSLEQKTVTVDGESTTFDALTEMPLTVTVTGAGEGGTTMLSVVRAETYHIDRPDETDLYGFEGETVATLAQIGEAQITINREDLIGRLDDGAAYKIIATVQDGLGQSASAELPFTVIWDHQASIPNGTVTIDADNLAAMLVPVAPSGVGTGDTCDIYRLSVDKPQLVYGNATYGQTYVDPYPALGEFGGYRFVMHTIDGDYITEDNELAWIDVEAEVDSNDNIIDFDGGRVLLSYNPDVSNSWKKDFKETKYLGGSVQGDWNPAVSRTSTVNSVAVTATDQETIEAMRRLATHAGICHVRTRDGSSYAADVQVSESYAVSNGNKLASFTLSITRVDPEGYDGMTLAEWNALHQEA